MASNPRHLNALRLLAASLVLVAACGGDDLLADVGHISRDFVYGATSTTTTIVVGEGQDRVIELVRATEVLWWNDDIPNQAFGEPGYVASIVWSRGDGTNRFIQASRAEIAAALPDIQFPELLPADVGWITSQLVYDVASATLDRGTAAAFGLWSTEPYTVDEGRLAVLRVGILAETQPGRSSVIADPVAEGVTFSWDEGAYRYELFCSTGLDPEVCERMVDTMAPLRLMLPPETATAGSEG